MRTNCINKFKKLSNKKKLSIGLKKEYELKDEKIKDLFIRLESIGATYKQNNKENPIIEKGSAKEFKNNISEFHNATKKYIRILKAHIKIKENETLPIYAHFINEFESFNSLKLVAMKVMRDKLTHYNNNLGILNNKLPYINARVNLKEIYLTKRITVMIISYLKKLPSFGVKTKCLELVQETFKVAGVKPNKAINYCRIVRRCGFFSDIK